MESDKRLAEVTVGEDEPDIGWPWKRGRSLLRQMERSISSQELRELVATGEDANMLDDDGYAPLHLIVKRQYRNRMDLIMTLMTYSNARIDVTTTKEGKSALHLAVEMEDIDAVKALIALGANVNLQDISGECGLTPLNLARLRAARNASENSDSSFKLRTLNVGHRVTLCSDLEAIQRGFEKTVEFSESLLAGAECMSDSKASLIVSLLESVGATSGPPSHYCGSVAHPLVSQPEQSLRLTTSSPVCLPEVNDVSSDSIEHADPLTKTSSSVYFKDLEESISAQIKELGIQPNPEEALELIRKIQESERYRQVCGSRILCLDGGGVKGLVQIEFLRQLEEKTGKRVIDLFDWIVGTSTGGIIALTLVYGRKSAREVQQIYLRVKGEVFKSGKGLLAKGNSDKLQEELQGWLGKDKKMSEISHPRVLIPAVNKVQSPLQLHFFNNCFEDQYSDELVWKVARYTSAAPPYFTEEDNYIDGGFLANNPCEDALTAIQEFYRMRGKKIPITLLVSVGCGMDPPKKLGKINIHDSINPKKWIEFLEMLGSAVVNRTTAENCQSRCKEQGISFFRFNPQYEEEVDSGETRVSKLIAMLWNMRVYLHQAREEIDKLVGHLEKSYLCMPEH